MESSSISPVKPTSTSFASKVKALLMRAWRERWSDHQWGVHLKSVVNSCNGDSKELPGQSSKTIVSKKRPSCLPSVDSVHKL